MMIDLRRIPLSELTRRVIERTGDNSWFALVVPDEAIGEAAEHLVAGLRADSPFPVMQLNAPADADALAAQGTQNGVLVASMPNDWTATQWTRLDLLRSRLQRKQTLYCYCPSRSPI